jgi:diacylglycerol kinase family enzyme
VLAEQLLDLRNAGASPVLDPRVRKVVLDVMKAAIAHMVMIDQEPLGSMGRAAHLERPHGLLLVNPRSGRGRPDAAELAQEAEARGVEAHILRQGEDAAELARASDAEALGMAGGDGSLGLVAGVALERDLPFVCVPFGTRNHFARDIGLDRNDPLGALAAFDSGRELRIDVGRVNERIFLNNVSFGIYARLVRRRETHRRRRDAFARLRALWLTARHRHPEPLTLDGERLDARILLIANNAYELDVFDLGARGRLDRGSLHAYIAHDWLPRAWDDRRGESFTVDGVGNLRAAVDGEPVDLGPRAQLRIEPGALRILVP